MFEKQETDKGLHQVLAPGENDIKDEDIKEEIFYIDSNGEFKELLRPTTVLRERKGKYFFIDFSCPFVLTSHEVGILIYPLIQ